MIRKICDNSTKASVIQRRDNGVPEMGSKNVQNCVTSFMGNPCFGEKSAKNRKMLVKLTKAL